MKNEITQTLILAASLIIVSCNSSSGGVTDEQSSSSFSQAEKEAEAKEGKQEAIDNSASGNILTMRIFEQRGGGLDITIVDEKGVVEQVKPSAIVGFSPETDVTINKALNRIVAKGYKLLSSSQGGTPPGMHVTTYIFSK